MAYPCSIFVYIIMGITSDTPGETERMKCQACQNDLSAGATFCTNCGTPVPSHSYGSPASASSPNQGIAPTLLASSTPPPNPYEPPASPYGQPPNPYVMPSTSYGAGAPPAYNPNAGASFVQPQYMPQQSQKKSPNGCVIAVIIVVSLFVLIVGGIVTAGTILVNKTSQNLNSTLTSFQATATAGMATVNALETPTTGTSSGLPSASQIDPNASANLSNAQTASSVDSKDRPTLLASSFNQQAMIYITYTFSGKAGYLMERTYDASDGTLVKKTATPHFIQSGQHNGVLSFSADVVGSYITGLYWCQQSDCSDAALAQVVSFTVF